MGVVGGRDVCGSGDGVCGVGCVTGAAWRSAYDHIYMVGTGGNEVGAGDDTSEDNHLECLAAGVGSFPHGGASVDLGADGEVAEVLA